jgi:outer membrane protein OmpA-like peptidoglycan-associated protein
VAVSKANNAKAQVVANALQENLRVLREDFTDSTGSSAHNQELSERRVEILLSDDAGKTVQR